MVFLFDLTMPEILRRIIAALLYAGLQGGLLALLLSLTGDRRPRDEGQLTLNPFRHVLLSGIFMAIAFRTSWIAPIAISQAQNRRQRLRPLAAVLSSFAVLLALVPLLDMARPWLHAVLPMGAGYLVLATIETLQFMLVGAVCIGLLPLPGMLLGNALPPVFPAIAKPYRKWQGLGLAAVAIIMVLGWFPDISPLVRALRIV